MCGTERSGVDSGAWTLSRPATGAARVSAPARLAPGTVLLGRYRIVALVGRGGMGEVYRADDLKLGEQVALKFLPESLEADPDLRVRFLNEVRLARQVSHPNVCRVHDIAEEDHRILLSMEYVDGEDLRSLIGRVGRLPPAKVIQLAHQLCAGLAAAHERGIVHRDLKPANIMVDGRGHARITDFGVAGIATEIAGDEVFAGTPAYMSPEQLAGREVTAASDLYALGLVLYEATCGEPAFTFSSIEEAAFTRQGAPPPRPSRSVEGLDPRLDEAIMACLRPDVLDRPVSARSVSASLPGGDALNYALEQGETPSPELVAGAVGGGALSRGQAWACLMAVAAGLLCVALLSERVQLLQLAPIAKSPAALIERARTIITRLAPEIRSADAAHGLVQESPYIASIEREDRSPARWDRLKQGSPEALRFWYRESPVELIDRFASANIITPSLPSPNLPGMVGIELDPRGRLRNLLVVPPLREPERRDATATGAPTAPATDWSAAFAEAGLDIRRFHATTSQWAPPQFADMRAAWTGTLPDAPEVPVRVEAAARGGRITMFRTIHPWTDRARATSQDSAWAQASRLIFVVVNPLMLIAGVIVARRNWLLGRGDRRGAVVIASVTLSLAILHWLFSSHHVAAFSELVSFYGAVGWGLMSSVTLLVLYLALEPYYRRLWPRTIVSSMRLLNGRIDDPTVGRDVLIGSAVGVGFTLVTLLGQVLPRWVGIPPPRPDSDLYGSVSDQMLIAGGLAQALGHACILVRDAIEWGIHIAIGLLVVRSIVRTDRVAIPVSITILALYVLRFGFRPSLEIGFALVYATIVIGLMMRLGVLTGIVALGSLAVCTSFPLTLRPAPWYAAQTAAGFVIVMSIAIGGFLVALPAGAAIRVGSASATDDVPSRA